jgi:AcrR family transcriptional regulator
MPGRTTLAATVAPRAAATAATRRAILDAAEHLLATVGEPGLSIREVCARAGVTAPTVYHHFGDKRALVDCVVAECFTRFDRNFRRRDVPADPVERLRWSFDRYVEYGLAHPDHYRLMFQQPAPRPTSAGRASYAGLERLVQTVADAGRLIPALAPATAAFWAAVHGVTALLISGFLKPGAPAAVLVRDAVIAQLTRPAPNGAPSARPRRRRSPGRSTP